MLTSFLKKYRPGTLFILGTILVLSSLFANFKKQTESYDLEFFGETIGISALGLIALLLFGFIVRKNKITNPSSFAIFLFVCYWMLFPQIFLNINILASNVFLLLALRRIISLGKASNTTKKILDSGIWISTASLFYFWSILFFVPLWWAILRKPERQFKDYLIPLIGIFSVLMITAGFLILNQGSLQWFKTWIKPIGLDFSIYNTRTLLFSTTGFISILLWSGAAKLLKINTYSLKERPKQYFLFFILIVSIFMAVLTPEKTGAEMIFLVPAAAIISTHFFEEEKSQFYKKRNKAEFIFKELLLWMLIFIAFWTLIFL